MSDDAPLEPVAPEPATPAADAAPTEPVPTDAAPTQPVPTATPPGPPPWTPPTAPSAEPAPEQPGGSSTVAVPKWLVLAVAAIFFAGLGFAIGYAVAPDDDNNDAAPLRPDSGFVIPSPFDNDGGSGNQPDIPSSRMSNIAAAPTSMRKPMMCRISRVG